MAQERLNKVMANAGIASRRACDEMIQAGRVTVNGKAVTELGVKVDPELDQVRVDGELIKARSSTRRSYLMLYKPAGVLSVFDDPRGRPGLETLLKGPVRLYPVGRLDLDSEGLLLLTDDGDLTLKLSHPRFEHAKTYLVLVDRAPGSDTLARFRRGIQLDDGVTASSQWRVLEHPAVVPPTDDPDATEGVWVHVTMHEGRKRQIRRMAAAENMQVRRLVRIGVGSLKLDRKLQPGQSRPLTRRELENLLEEIETGAPAMIPRRREKGAGPGSERAAKAAGLVAGQRPPRPGPAGPRPRPSGMGSDDRGRDDFAERRGPGGPRPSGPRPAGARPSGPRSDDRRRDDFAERRGPGGPRPSGPRPAGPRPSGPRADERGRDDFVERRGPGGPRPSGPRPAGPRPSSPRAAERGRDDYGERRGPGGPRPAGPRPSGPRADERGRDGFVERRGPGGPRPSGQRPTGPRPSGPRPAGPRTDDRQRDDFGERRGAGGSQPRPSGPRPGRPPRGEFSERPQRGPRPDRGGAPEHGDSVRREDSDRRTPRRAPGAGGPRPSGPRPARSPQGGKPRPAGGPKPGNRRPEGRSGGPPRPSGKKGRPS